EGQPGAVGERLEPLQVDRLQIHLSPKGRRSRQGARNWKRRAPPRTLCSAPKLLQSPPGGRLLGLLLAPPRTRSDLVAAHRGADLETTSVRRADLIGDLVAHDVPVLGTALLELCFEVRPPPPALVDLMSECLDDGLGGPLEAPLEVAGADHRFADRGERSFRGEQ